MREAPDRMVYVLGMPYDLDDPDDLIKLSKLRRDYPDDVPDYIFKGLSKKKEEGKSND